MLDEKREKRSGEEYLQQTGKAGLEWPCERRCRQVNGLREEGGGKRGGIVVRLIPCRLFF